MWNIMKRVLVLLSPTLIGLVFLRILLVLPSPLENILYWLGPIAMTIYWLWIGACAATKGSMSFVPSLLYSHAGVLLCVVLFLLLPYMGYGSAYQEALRDILSAFALPLLPLIMVLWLFIGDASMDAHAHIINMVGSTALLMVIFSIGFAYMRSKRSAKGDAPQE